MYYSKGSKSGGEVRDIISRAAYEHVADIAGASRSVRGDCDGDFLFPGAEDTEGVNA